MKEEFILIAHLLVTVAKLSRPGGLRAVAAESLAIKQQLLIIKRAHQRAPTLTPWERLVLGLCSLCVSTKRRTKMAVVLKTSTLLYCHQALVQCKYHLLYTPKIRGRPGPKGPSKDVIAAVVEMKRKNPKYACLRIAQAISHAFGIDLKKDVVRRILSKHYHPDPTDTGPSWLTVIGHAKDSLWSIDLFKCESILLRSFWVLVVTDVFTRRFIGINHAITGRTLPKYVSSDHDPLFQSHRWLANLRILGIEEIKTVPFTPVSHPFVERLIGTIRRELLDQVLFWNQIDLERILTEFRTYYNLHRVHNGILGVTPEERGGGTSSPAASLHNFRWQLHCHGLFATPISA